MLSVIIVNDASDQTAFCAAEKAACGRPGGRIPGVSACFVPGHITGFFEIVDDDDPHVKGSRGCGLVTDRGLTTVVRAVPQDDEEASRCPAPAGIRVFLNGASVPGRIVRSVLALMGLPGDRPCLVEVSGNADLPVGCGFGMSAAGALGTAFAANDLFDMGYSSADLIEIAHAAEVLNGSGLGDAAGCSTGGLVLREKAGGTRNGLFRRVDVPPKKIFCLAIGALETSSVLADPDSASRIRAAGHEAMSAFLKKETLWSFMDISLDFSKRVGLMSADVRAVVDALDPALAKASQAMLGNTVFAVTADFSEKTDDPALLEKYEQAAEQHILETFSGHGDVIVCRIGFQKPFLIRDFRPAPPAFFFSGRFL